MAPFLSRGFGKLGAALVAAAPGDEARLLASDPAVAAALGTPGALLIVGERLATVPGGLSAAAALAARTGARLAWVPRRAGDRGAVDAGCLPNLLPGGRPVADAAAAPSSPRPGTSAGTLPGTAGRDTDGIIAAAADGALGGLLVAGVDPGDLADPLLAEQALDAVRLPGQPRAAAERGDPARRRGAAGGPGGREVRHLHGLGGPAPLLRDGAADHGDDRRPGARGDRRAAGASRWAPVT